MSEPVHVFQSGDPVECQGHVLRLHKPFLGRDGRKKWLCLETSDTNWEIDEADLKYVGPPVERQPTDEPLKLAYYAAR